MGQIVSVEFFFLHIAENFTTARYKKKLALAVGSCDFKLGIKVGD